MADKKQTGLWRNNPDSREGKYLVTRRDGSTPEWPWFVLGAKDPASPWALRIYAVVALLCGMGWRYAVDCWRLASAFNRFRKAHGNGDPSAPRHRTDDPATVARMQAAQDAGGGSA